MTDETTDVDFIALFRNVHARPVVFGIRKWHVRNVVPYVLGCDAATGYQLLGQGFASWLNLRRGGAGRTNMTWDGEVVAHQFANHTTRLEDVSDEDSEAMLAYLFDCLEMYLSERGAVYSVTPHGRSGPR